MRYPEDEMIKERSIAEDSNYHLAQAKYYLEQVERNAQPRLSLEVQQAHRIGMLEADLNNAMQRLRETEQQRNLLQEQNEAADRAATYAASRWTELNDRHNALYAKHQNLVQKMLKKPAAKKRTVKK